MDHMHPVVSLKRRISDWRYLAFLFFVLFLSAFTLHYHLSYFFPSLSHVHQVRVIITDENDCVPEFLQSIYSKEGVPETVTTATSLLQGKTVYVDN